MYTVESAYNQLNAEGFIERRIGSGSFALEPGNISQSMARCIGGLAMKRCALARAEILFFRVAVCATS